MSGSNKGTQAMASRVELDGPMRKIPGFAAGVYNGDQLPLFIPRTASVNLYGGASGNLSAYLMPVDYKAIAAFLQLVVAPGTGPAAISIGTTGNTTSILNAYSVLTAATAGWADLSANAAFLAPTGSQGDIIVFNTDGGGTATGSAYWGCTIVPN